MVKVRSNFYLRYMVPFKTIVTRCSRRNSISLQELTIEVRKANSYCNKLKCFQKLWPMVDTKAPSPFISSLVF